MTTEQDKWNAFWQEFESIDKSCSPYGEWLHRQRSDILRHIVSRFPSSFSVIDIGCGSGETLNFVRDLGFKNSIGIDISKSAIKRCVDNGLVEGKDVFVIDGKYVSFPDKSFDIVYEDGMLEHFKDWRPYLREIVRLSKNYILLMRPNHFSLAGAILRIGGLLFSKTLRELAREYSYPLSYFTQFLSFYDFKLVVAKYTLFHEQAWLVYKRNR